MGRNDRDENIKIHWSNIIRGMSYNFNKKTKRELADINTDYDIGSVMHYPSNAFTSNGRETITDLNDRPITTQRDGMSDTDIKEINALYGCNKGGGALTTTTEAPIVPVTAGSCTNIHNQQKCEIWAEQGLCTDPKYEVWLAENCCESCSGKEEHTTTTTTTTPTPTTTTTTTTVKVTTADSSCVDRNQYCSDWARRGECRKNPAYMGPNCCKSCKAVTTGTTTGTTSSDCRDESKHCSYWAGRGECQKNARYMLQNCCRSCKAVNSGRQASSTCRDSRGWQQTCQGWRRQGWCQNNYYHATMFTNCRRTCGLC